MISEIANNSNISNQNPTQLTANEDINNGLQINHKYKFVEPITFKDLQEFFGVDKKNREYFSLRKLQRLVQRGCMKVTRIGRFTFLTEKQLKEWLDNHEAIANKPAACVYCRKQIQHVPTRNREQAAEVCDE